MRKAEPESQISEAPGAGEAQPTDGEALLPVEPATINAEQLEELKARATKADEHWDRLLRTTADFENFKKRAARERQDAIKYANEALIEKLLTVLDNFEMAQAAVQAGAPDALKSLQEGVAMIHQQLRNVLTGAGLEEVEAGGKPFDPNLHEAVSQEQTEAVPEGHVAQQLRKGYKLRERLLRPASVIVATKPAPQA
ncbi:MAG: nucleotide exchange factor GrpE [Verrucomicrobiae bacterium]|nr:nucleotide exchange factor GrpE [Verrucomicrobiae bacterium]